MLIFTIYELEHFLDPETSGFCLWIVTAAIRVQLLKAVRDWVVDAYTMFVVFAGFSVVLQPVGTQNFNNRVFETARSCFLCDQSKILNVVHSCKT